jgi:hypothetical protein
VEASSSRSIETKIRRLTHEIRKIDEFFYETNKDASRDLYAGMLERKRDDMVRSAVLQLHTAIEGVLTSWITCRVLGIRMEEQGERARTKAGQALRRLMWGNGSIGFDMKLQLAVTQRKLEELNRLRNKCSHDWLLKVPVRRGRRPKQKKLPLLLYRGRDLHGVETLEDFTREYGLLYARLFTRYLG